MDNRDNQNPTELKTMTTKKLTDYIKQSASMQTTEKTGQPKPAQARIQFKKETEFQETPMGKIPKKWHIVKLCQVAILKNGQRPQLVENGHFPVYGANGVMGSTNQYLVDSDYTLIIGRVGAAGQVHLARGRIWVSDNAIYTENYDKNKVFLPYLYYLLITKRLERCALKTTHPIITQTFVKNILVPLPSTDEQKVIAEILSTVDLAINRVRGLVERAEKLKKGLMQELFTKGIGHKEFKETPIGKIPKEWRVVRLGEVCNPVREIIEPRSSDISAPYVGLEHVEPGRFFLTRWGTAEEAISSKYKFRKGDILYGRLRPYLDKCVIATIDGLCSTDFIVIRANANLILPEYMVAILHTEKFIKYATSTMRGTNHPRTSWESISRYLLPLPPINEQAEISNILLSIDRYIGLLKNKHELLSHIKRSLMNILLTGKVRIIVDSSEGVSGG